MPKKLYVGLYNSTDDPFLNLAESERATDDISGNPSSIAYGNYQNCIKTTALLTAQINQQYQNIVTQIGTSLGNYYKNNNSNYDGRPYTKDKATSIITDNISKVGVDIYSIVNSLDGSIKDISINNFDNSGNINYNSLQCGYGLPFSFRLAGDITIARPKYSVSNYTPGLIIDLSGTNDLSSIKIYPVPLSDLSGGVGNIGLRISQVKRDSSGVNVIHDNSGILATQQWVNNNKSTSYIVPTLIYDMSYNIPYDLSRTNMLRYYLTDNVSDASSVYLDINTVDVQPSDKIRCKIENTKLKSNIKNELYTLYLSSLPFTFIDNKNYDIQFVGSNTNTVTFKPHINGKYRIKATVTEPYTYTVEEKNSVYTSLKLNNRVDPGAYISLYKKNVNVGVYEFYDRKYLTPGECTQTNSSISFSSKFNLSPIPVSQYFPTFHGSLNSCVFMKKLSLP